MTISYTRLVSRASLAIRASSLLVPGLFALLSAGPVAGAEVIKIPMTGDHWTVEGNAEFVQKDGFAALELKPRNAEMKMGTGRAVLNNLVFRDGTIEYDVEATGMMGAGFAFRRRDKDAYEDFYLRPSAHCEQAPDCIQYAPQTHGVLLWDLFPQYQGPAPLKESGWNHVKLVVSGQRMNVFINGTSSPTLKVGKLEGDVLEGGLMLEGPGVGLKPPGFM